MSNGSSQAFPRSTRSRTASSDSQRRPQRSRPSSAGYLIVAVTIAIALFFGVWLMDDATWVPAGLAALVVLLIFFSAREVVMRRAWTRYLLDQDSREHTVKETSRKSSSSKSSHSSGQHASALRTIQRQSVEADAGATPEVHLDLFHLCQDYVSNTDEAMQANSLSAEGRLALRAGQEKVRSLQKHHLLVWARDTARAQTHEAQQRARTFDKIETANRALDCIETALKAYPGEAELEASKLAIREFIGSVKVAHWVELAERSEFKGQHRRAIERYQDALFYLDRETVDAEVRLAGSERIMREIDRLRSRLKASGKSEQSASAKAKSD